MAKTVPGSREEDSWFSEEQLAKVAPADEVDELRSPIPTQMVSNGEYMPEPQTEQQKRVEARLKELADTAAKKLGVSRRAFLGSSGGNGQDHPAHSQTRGGGSAATTASRGERLDLAAR